MSDYRRMVVSAVRADGNVNLTWGGALVDAGGDGIPALDSYTSRGVGDNVLVLVDDAGMLVMGKAGAGKGAGAVEYKDIIGKPDLSAQGVPDIPDPKDFPPTSSALWQDSWGGWHRTQAINSGRPVQGCYPGAPLNHGGWFYGSTVVDGCAGHTVANLWIDLSRSSEYHGDPRDVAVYLYLITQGTPSSGLPTFSDGIRGPNLQRGGTVPGKGFKLPPSHVTALSTGAARGVGVQGYASDDSYVRFAPCGRLHAEFNA